MGYLDKYKNKKRRLQYLKKWRAENPNKIRKHNKNWYKKKYKDYFYKNGQRIRERVRERRKEDPKFQLDSNIKAAVGHCLRGEKAWRKWESLVGYTIDDLMKHLERQFDDKMNWNNYGSYWSVDHIKPKSLFRYKTTEDPKFKKCWGLENLQPMEKVANMRKSNKFSSLRELTRRTK